MATVHQSTEPRGAYWRFFETKPWNAAIYLVLNFALGVLWFVVLVTLIATGAGTLITIFGAYILAGAYHTWRFAAQFERLRIKAFFGEVITTPPPMDQSGTLGIRVRRALSDDLAWREFFYIFLLFPVGIAEFVLVAVLVSLPFGLLSTLATYRSHTMQMHLGIWNVDTLPKALLVALAGLLLLPPCSAALVALANGHRALARALLSPRGIRELEERVGSLTISRSGAVDAALAERRRIERDLHDGAQQRLVKLAMDLGMAREQLATDPARAEELIANAHAESKVALAELRDLVRGIHPAILTDRGLDAALSAVADRTRVPVAVDVSLPNRLPEAVESAAYFVVLEALANVDKHASATAARVSVKQAGETLVVDVDDNGRGGAAAVSGGGLAGLRDRVAALDGRLSVVSPDGGPTHIHAEIPCARSSPKTQLSSEKASSAS